MKKASALPLFGDAYLADTRHLSLEEHGAYLQLLLIAWRTEDCALPNDDKRIARMLGVTVKRWEKLKPSIMAFWTLTENGWQQKRLLKERQFVAKKSEQNSEAANTRWNANSLKTNEVDDANASLRQCERNAPPPLPIKEEKIMPDTSGDYAFFGQTIKLAPRHFSEWKRLFHTIPDIEAELSVLDGWWQQQPEAKRENWFLATKGMLNKKHQSNLAAQREAEADPNAFYMP
jgi:uncharacterized protein YdaU (DUF1376 family)